MTAVDAVILLGWGALMSALYWFIYQLCCYIRRGLVDLFSNQVFDRMIRKEQRSGWIPPDPDPILHSSH